MLFHLLKLNLKPLPTDEEEAGPPVATRKGVLVGGLVLAAVAAGGVVVGRVSCHQSSTAGSMSISSPAGSAVAVVGNGMLTDEDRRLIDTFDEVIRFNDMTYWRPGERVTMRVVRAGSQTIEPPPEAQALALPVWYLAAFRGALPEGAERAARVSYVYERQFGACNALSAADARVFHGTCAGSLDRTCCGVSSGAAVLSALEHDNVSHIHVFVRSRRCSHTPAAPGHTASCCAVAAGVLGL